jgi:hypothetical protein
VCQPDTPGGVNVSRRVNLHLAEEFAQQIEAQKPRSLALSAFCALLIEEGLTGGLAYPRTVSVREPQLGNHHAHTPPSNEADLVRSASEGETVLSSVPPQVVGDGVGRESEGTPRKGTSWKKTIPPVLDCHSDVILAFWDHKAGAKSEAAWKLLLTELSKIQERYGERVVRDQLELAAANRFKSVTLKNYEQFESLW